MAAELAEKVERYERLLAEALDVAEPTSAAGTPLEGVADEFAGMARAYLEDGRHFAADGDPVNALAAFSYGHAWLDAGARLGVFDVPDGGSLFAV